MDDDANVINIKPKVYTFIEHTLGFIFISFYPSIFVMMNEINLVKSHHEILQLILNHSRVTNEESSDYFN